MIKELLMCNPLYYTINYSINNWTSVNRQVDHKLAMEQWENLYNELSRLGVSISLLEPVKGVPDLCFTGDAGMVHNGKFLISNFRHRERQPEVEYYVRWAEQNGYEVCRIPEHIFFEGLGDVVQYGNNYFIGYGERSAKEAAKYVEDTYPELNRLGILEIDNADFFHNSHAIALLSENTAMYYPGAFSLDTLETIRSTSIQLLEIDLTDAQQFVCNNIVVGNKILIDDCSSALQTTLEQQGYELIKCPMSEFKKTGASLRCLVLTL